MKLIIGNRNYSSWSLRAWLAVRIADANCDVWRVPLYQPESRSTLARLSPTGKVPVLETDHGIIWDSLAIGEYLAERFPNSALWPKEPEVVQLRDPFALRSTAASAPFVVRYPWI